MRKIYVFDTTLRDGEQVPGAKLNQDEKVRISRQLEKMKVDFMEVGFPSSSKGDFDAVKAISKQVCTSTVVALGRAVKSDIDAMYNSLKYAQSPMIHIVLGSSNVHLDKKFRKSPAEVLQMGTEAVAYAKKYMSQVEYSLEDASRSDFEYMWQTIESVVKAGATCVNIPDTVGYAVPEIFGQTIEKIYDRLQNIAPEVLLSVHCHNDTGLATANTLTAVRNGANKVECTINGIGERAGNTSLEEVVMGIWLHPDYYDGYTDINTKEIYQTSRMVSRTMGLDIQVNKAIVGENAFAHSSGIHQDGLLKSKDVYEIFEPDDVGAPPMDIVLTARSGKHAFSYVAQKIGYSLPENKFDEIHSRFLKMADEKKEVYDNDIIDMLEAEEGVTNEKARKCWKIKDIHVEVIGEQASADVELWYGKKSVSVSGNGAGAVEALYSAILSVVDSSIELIDFRIQNIGKGADSIAKANVQIRHDGHDYFGKAMEGDVMKASALALVNSLNRMKIMQKS